MEPEVARTVAGILDTDRIESQVKRACCLCGNGFSPGESDDRLCPLCRAHAAGSAGIDRGRRRHVRLEVEKPVKLRRGEGAYDGRLKNLSYSGAAVESVALTFETGQVVELESEEFGVLYGPVVRTNRDGFAITFDMDDAEKTNLLDWVAGIETDPDNT